MTKKASIVLLCPGCGGKCRLYGNTPIVRCPHCNRPLTAADADA